MVALLGDRVRLLEQVLRGPLELRDVRAVDHVDDGGLAEVRAQHLQVVQGSAPVFADRSPGGLTERDAGVPLERRTEADRGIRGAAAEQSGHLEGAMHGDVTANAPSDLLERD